MMIPVTKFQVNQSASSCKGKKISFNKCLFASCRVSDLDICWRPLYFWRFCLQYNFVACFSAVLVTLLVSDYMFVAYEYCKSISFLWPWTLIRTAQLRMQWKRFCTVNWYQPTIAMCANIQTYKHAWTEMI